MTNRKNQNSILFLATLGVCLGLFIVGGETPVWGQSEKNEVAKAVNREPWAEWAKLSQKEVEQGNDLTSPFRIEMSSRLDANGKFETSTIKWVRAEGNVRTVALVKDAILSVSDSGYFSYLQSVLSSDLHLAIRQDKDNFGSDISFAFANEDQAKRRASSLNMLISVAIASKKDKQDMTSDEKRDIELLRTIAVESVGNKVVMKSSMPTANFRQMMADIFK